MERCPIQWSTEYGPSKRETNGRLWLLMSIHVFCENNKDWFMKTMPLKPKTFTLILNKMFAILRYILTQPLKLYLRILEMDVFVWKPSVISYFRQYHYRYKQSLKSVILLKLWDETFNYSGPVTCHQLLESNCTPYQDLLPNPIGMNLTLVRELLQHDGLYWLLKQVQENGQRALITVHHDAKEIHHVLDRVKKDGEHNWWESLFGWSLTATGTLNLMFHPVLILLALTILGLLFIIILYVKFWYVTKQTVLVHHMKSPNNVQK